MRKWFGLVLMGFSVTISVGNLLVTGAVVGDSVSNYVSLVSVVMFLAGALILLGVSQTLEESVDEGLMLPSDAAKVLNLVSSGERRSLVVDTSYLGAFGDSIKVGQLFDLLEGYDSIVVADGVIGELDNGPRNIRDISNLLLGCKGVVASSDNMSDYEGVARSYLELGYKKMVRDKLVPIVLGEKKAPKTKREAAPLRKETKKIIRWLKEGGKTLSRENIVAVLDRHYEVSGTDVSVLASALAEVYDNPGSHVVLAEKDVDFEYAIDLIKNGGEGVRSLDVGDRIHYSTPYASKGK